MNMYSKIAQNHHHVMGVRREKVQIRKKESRLTSVDDTMDII